ncbi:MAG: hypothetical protein QOI80_3192 [Solirubrobacteraceae bacterium]|jgi:uncharacterized membrane protein YidH (DUF202 family)|nr:hypothetical protein [Solirubrobacteraceae bacterium]MEA2384012.1 hypothetical protein [Solirubrobacteraceae bacterium]
MTRAPGGRLFDPGLQLERTHLAWSRTALAFLADAAFMARASARVHPAWLGIAVAVTLAMTGAGAWWHGRRSYAVRSEGLRRGLSPVRPRALRATAIVTTVVAVAAAALAVTTLLG